MNKILRDLLNYVIVLISLIIIWHIIALILNKAYVPTPLDVLKRTYIDLVNKILIDNTMISLYRIFVALVFSTSIGFIVGVISIWARYRFVSDISKTLVFITYPIPHVTLLPILFFLFNIELSKIILIAIITFYPITLSIIEWSQRFPKDLADIISLMGGRRTELIRYVILPSSLPGILTGLRISLNTAYAVIFIAESMVGNNGIGYLIYWYWQRLDYTGMYSAILFLSIIGVSTYLILLKLEKKILRWIY